jgi:hypothetical protein
MILASSGVTIVAGSDPGAGAGSAEADWMYAVILRLTAVLLSCVCMDTGS